MLLRFALTAILTLAAPGAALACGDPTEEWYVAVSDVVFDGSARCQLEERSCRITVNRVFKNPLNLGIEQRPFEVDFQNWYADSRRANPDLIIITCGVPVFEPDQERFRARFYANLNQSTGELVVRRHVLRGTDLEESQE